MARLYADECFSRPVVEELRKLGHDVLTAHTLVVARSPDRATCPDRRSPVRRGETFGQSPWHGQETVPQQATTSFSRPVVEELRKLGHDVFTAHEAGQANLQISDIAQLAFAVAHARAIMSFNRRHFKQLHK